MSGIRRLLGAKTYANLGTRPNMGDKVAAHMPKKATGSWAAGVVAGEVTRSDAGEHGCEVEWSHGPRHWIALSEIAPLPDRR